MPQIICEYWNGATTTAGASRVASTRPAWPQPMSRPASASSPTSRQPGRTKVEGTMGALTSMIATNRKNRIEALVSRAPIRLSVTRPKEPVIAASAVTTCPKPSVAKSGRIMTRTPTKPRACADQRCQPTSSRSSTAESAVTRIGVANRIA